MAEIKRVYRQTMPAVKLVGRCYREEDKENGVFANKWGEWFQNDLFAPLQLSDAGEEPFEDCDAYIGLCRCKEGEPFQFGSVCSCRWMPQYRMDMTVLY